MSAETDDDLDPELSRQLDAYFATIGQGVNAYLEGRAQRRQIAFLAKLDDTDLARLGITRDEIVRHVFRHGLRDRPVRSQRGQ